MVKKNKKTNQKHGLLYNIYLLKVGSTDFVNVLVKCETHLQIKLCYNSGIIS